MVENEEENDGSDFELTLFPLVWGNDTTGSLVGPIDTVTVGSHPDPVHFCLTLLRFHVFVHLIPVYPSFLPGFVTRGVCVEVAENLSSTWTKVDGMLPGSPGDQATPDQPFFAALAARGDHLTTE